MTMTKEYILTKLCDYDKRNPENVLDEEYNLVKKKGVCYCDNCFYGRTELAEKLLELYTTFNID